MNTLTTFRDHCRRMAAGDHTDECWQRLTDWSRAMDRRRWYGALETPDPGPRPTCDGCIPESDRALWTRLADEIDDHLAPHPDLFGEMSSEPARPGGDDREDEA